MYQLSGKDKLYEWLEQETDAECRQLMLEWLADLCADPLRYGHRVPGVRAPVYLAVAPFRRCTLKFLLDDQFHVIRMIEFGTLG